jgi:hypothetical protein
MRSRSLGLLLLTASGCGKDHVAAADFAVLNGTIGPTQVVRVAVPVELRKANWLVVEDSGAPTGANGSFTGFDIDGAVVSKTKCESADCVQKLVIAKHTARPAQYVFIAGGIRNDSFAERTLQGSYASGLGIDESSATLGAFDADTSGTGFLSLGAFGTLAMRFAKPLSNDDYIYLGDVGGNDKLLAKVTLWASPPKLAESTQSPVYKARSTASPCDDPRYGEILKAGFEKGLNCLAELAPDLAKRLRAMDITKVATLCYRSFEDQACAFVRSSNEIQINTARFDSRGLVCGTSPEGALFHEIMHFLPQMSHRKQDQGYYDELDRTYACGRTCFPQPKSPIDSLTSCTSCARQTHGSNSFCERKVCSEMGCNAGCFSCEGKMACADGGWRCSKCGGRHKLLAPGQECATNCDRTYCPCNDPGRGKPKQYASELECAVECPSGLKCFNTQCAAPPGCTGK